MNVKKSEIQELSQPSEKKQSVRSFGLDQPRWVYPQWEWVSPLVRVVFLGFL